jgi:hypothetical protein
MAGAVGAAGVAGVGVATVTVSTPVWQCVSVWVRVSELGWVRTPASLVTV